MRLARVQRLQAQAAAANLAVVAVVPGPNMHYFTGLSFHLSERPAVAFFPVEGWPVLVVPALEIEKAQTAPFETHIFTYDDVSGPAQAFAQAVKALQLATQPLGVEGRRIRYLELDLLERAAQTRPHITNADPLFAELRMRKDPSEIEAMRRAVEIAQQAVEATLPHIRPGTTEKALAARLTLQLYQAGSDPELPFSPIVATGPNSANPHAFPSDRPVQAGDFVILDWGASSQGYFSDITRTYAIGQKAIDPQLRRAYQAVLEANQAGRDAAKPGASGQEVDQAARAVIEAAGLGQYFIHRTGHGLGLEAHEEPDMKAGVTLALERGMTFTVEPGVYLPGLGGIRIEDDVVITKTGSESLTTLPRQLITLG